MKNVRLAVIGAGHFGRHHVRILSGMEGVEMVGVCDRNAARAKERGEEHGVPVFTDPADLPDDLDGVVVAVPTVHHLEVAESFLVRGTAVLVEKPLAEDLGQAKALCLAAEEGGAILDTHQAFEKRA